MPFTFVDNACRLCGGYGVGGRVTGVTGNVGSRGSVTGGASRGAGRGVIKVACGGVGGKCGGTDSAKRHLAARPGTPRLDGFARSVVLRILFLEEGEHVFGAVGGPKHQGPMIRFVECLHLLIIAFIIM